MEVKIVRYETITVKDATLNSYGDLVVNGGIKINKKRMALFPVFQVGAEVKLGYGNYMNKDYVATAEQTGKHEVPKDTSLVEAAKSIGAIEIKEDNQPRDEWKPTPLTSQSVTLNDKMSKEDWDEKDRRTRKSIERQKALELAVNFTLSYAEKIEDLEKEVIKIAKRFETYLQTGG
jgi:hypothetical protein